MMIGLISSVPEEGKEFISQLKEKFVLVGKTVHKGKIDGKDVVYIVSGMGKTNAAHAATLLAECFSLDLVILFGVGGAYPSTGLSIGDVAVAEKEIYGDEGVLDNKGFHGTEFIGIPLLKRGRKRYFNEFLLDQRFLKMALGISKRITHHASLITAVKSGAFVTVSTCTGTRKRALELEKRFDALCENMEGAAVAHICALYGVPLIEIRGISNIVEDRDRSKWDIPLAAENCRKAVKELLTRLPYPHRS